jgi:alpha,alpha-trehalase
LQPINQTVTTTTTTTTTYRLLTCVLHQTSTYSYPPSGLRVYYEERSAPPLLTEMVRQYLKAIDDEILLDEALPILEREYEWWMLERSVRLTPEGVAVQFDDTTTSPVTYVLNQYRAFSNVPRPEAFAADVAIVKKAFGLTSDDAMLPNRIYRDLASAAESGWEMSSRWYSHPWDNSTIHTLDLIPVDLNSILYKNELTLADWYSTKADKATTVDLKRAYQIKASAYEAAADKRLIAMQRFLWNDDASMWSDYDTFARAPVNKNREGFYQSSIFPIWAGVTRNIESVQLEQPISRAAIEQRVFDAMQSSGLFTYKGGIPASTVVCIQASTWMLLE